ncbi:MAG: hypothetical protein AB1710_04535 [Pseudomonadota bacterium]
MESPKGEIGRIVSLLVAIASLAIAYFFGKGGTFHLALTVLVLPLGCIWYGSEIGGFVGAPVDGEVKRGNIAGTLITVAGWVVLFAILAGLILSALGD